MFGAGACRTPHFLGLLRNSVDPETSKCLAATVEKDYTDSDVRELMTRLETVIYPAKE